MRQLNHSTAANLRRLIILTDHLTDIFLNFEPGKHDLVAAAQASKPQIRTGSQNLPAFVSARVFLLHKEDIV